MLLRVIIHDRSMSNWIGVDLSNSNWFIFKLYFQKHVAMLVRFLPHMCFLWIFVSLRDHLTGVWSRVMRVPWGTSVHASVCMWKERRPWATVDLLLGPMTARTLFVSFGRLLTETALIWRVYCCYSQIYTRTHELPRRAHTHINPVSCGTLGAVQPTYNRGHLAFTEGENNHIWYLNVQCSVGQEVGVVVMWKYLKLHTIILL